MERPNVKNQPKKREVTGEIVYLDQMRYNGKGYLGRFSELDESRAELYNARAGAYRTLGAHFGHRPEIMDLYDEYDSRLSDTEASCIALADELLALKDKDSPLTFVDVCVDVPASEVLGRLKAIRAGGLLAAGDEQLAIESDGQHYPVLDMRKEQAELVGVGLRVWGWDHEKYVYTDSSEADRDFKRDLLVYPMDEKLAQRQLELTFIYSDGHAAKDGSGQFSESISLFVNEHGGSSFTRSITSMAYAESGYEGHKHQNLNNISEADVAAFGDLVAEVVGDVPESIRMRENRQLNELMDRVVNQAARDVMKELIDKTWPAQASYILRLRPKDSNQSIAKMLQSESEVKHAIALLRGVIDK